MSSTAENGRVWRSCAKGDGAEACPPAKGIAGCAVNSRMTVAPGRSAIVKVRLFLSAKAFICAHPVF
ncbi:MAG: hypothetical protein IKA95_04550 [Clostridia bacterium]|nr:hypothetical protein [Clostridia bacterium]